MGLGELVSPLRLRGMSAILARIKRQVVAQTQRGAGAEPPRIGILTVSDRASRGDYPDESGPAVRAALDELLTRVDLGRARSCRTMLGTDPRRR